MPPAGGSSQRREPDVRVDGGWSTGALVDLRVVGAPRKNRRTGRSPSGSVSSERSCAGGIEVDRRADRRAVDRKLHLAGRLTRKGEPEKRRHGRAERRPSRPGRRRPSFCPTVTVACARPSAKRLDLVPASRTRSPAPSLRGKGRGGGGVERDRHACVVPGPRSACRATLSWRPLMSGDHDGLGRRRLSRTA